MNTEQTSIFLRITTSILNFKLHRSLDQHKARALELLLQLLLQLHLWKNIIQHFILPKGVFFVNLLTENLWVQCHNVNYYESVHRHIPSRDNREHPGNFQNQYKLFFQLSVQVYSLGQTVVQGARREDLRLSPRAFGCHKR